MIIVVLGCTVRRASGAEGLAPGAAQRRVDEAARAFAESEGRGDAPIVIASGGRTWGGAAEADVMADALAAAGVPRERIVRERCSFSTRENARYVARLLFRRGVVPDVSLVTCAWHMRRAAALFRSEGVAVTPRPAASPTGSWVRRRVLDGRERVAAWLDGVGR